MAAGPGGMRLLALVTLALAAGSLVAFVLATRAEQPQRARIHRPPPRALTPIADARHPAEPSPSPAAAAAAAAVPDARTRVGAPVVVNATTDERMYRTCCNERWRSAWQPNRSEICRPPPAGVRAAAEASAPPSSLACYARGGVAWFCELEHFVLDPRAGGFEAVDYSHPTISNPFVWQPGVLALRGCALDRVALRALRFSGPLSRILPSALAEGAPDVDAPADGPGPAPTRGASAPLATPPPGGVPLAAGGAELRAGSLGAEDVLTVLLVRISPKNFWLGHYDFLQLYAMLALLCAGERGRARPRVQIVLMPPDKATAPGSRAFWGGHALLWAALSDEPLATFAQLGGRARRVRRAIVGVSGFHSNYGRGVIGKALEAACAAPCAPHCARGAPCRTSAFYRGATGSVLEALGALPYALPRAGAGGGAGGAAAGDAVEPATEPPRAAGGLRVLWISRGRGAGGAYGATVERRCLNEPEVAAAVRARTAHGLTMADFAAIPFAAQLRLLRQADVLTGMHGAGYANMIWLPPHAAVAELCPRGYCTNSFQRLAGVLGLAYVRWTNAHAENAHAHYNTVVHVDEFLRTLGLAAGRVLAELGDVADDK